MSTEPPTLQTPIEILQAALKKEKDAYHFSTVLFLQELLEHLRDEEHKHVLMIEKILTKMQSGT